MARWKWMAGGTLTAAALLASLNGPAAGPTAVPVRPATSVAQPVVSHDDRRPVRPQQEPDYLELHRHLQQLMKDRRQYRNDLEAGASAGRIQADRDAIKRDVQLARQVRLRIQENSRSDRYRHGQRPTQSVRRVSR